MRKLMFMLGMLMVGSVSAKDLPIIQGVKFELNKLHLLMRSTGCTTNKSFQLVWQEQTLTIVRIKPDGCRRMPHNIWLEFELPKDASAFKLTNPISQ